MVKATFKHNHFLVMKRIFGYEKNRIFLKPETEKAFSQPFFSYEKSF